MGRLCSSHQFGGENQYLYSVSVVREAIYWRIILQLSFFLKALLHFLQREQEMRVGELGPRGAINMGGTGMIV